MASGLHIAPAVTKVETFRARYITCDLLKIDWLNKTESRSGGRGGDGGIVIYLFNI